MSNGADELVVEGCDFEGLVCLVLEGDSTAGICACGSGGFLGSGLLDHRWSPEPGGEAGLLNARGTGGGGRPGEADWNNGGDC